MRRWMWRQHTPSGIQQTPDQPVPSAQSLSLSTSVATSGEQAS